MSGDLLYRYMNERRAAALPPPRAGLRDAILEEYDSTAPARPSRRMIQLVAAAAAASAIAGILFIWNSKLSQIARVEAPRVAALEIGPKPPASEDALLQSILLNARVAAVKTTLDAMRRNAPIAAPDLKKNSRTIAGVAALTGQPIEPVYRLVAARMFEKIDKTAALDRYRELLKEYPQGPACAVAKDRIQALTP
ncbi:MAG: hypothetical protein HY286_11580 [Planctomycetes bacterium]|nr:hypothetical protein [Planctomycetota bacterium]